VSHAGAFICKVELESVSNSYSYSRSTNDKGLNGYWLGWMDGSKTHYLNAEPISAWKRIEEAYNAGKADYKG
jgi:hypothetical protein